MRKLLLILFISIISNQTMYSQSNSALKIRMVSVLVNDPVAAHKFYTETLGFETHTFMPKEQVAIIHEAGNKQGTTIILEPKGTEFGKDFQETAYQKGLPVIIFGSDNVQAEYERLVEKGVKFKQKPTLTDWGTLATFDDTCGNYIQIHQEPK